MQPMAIALNYSIKNIQNDVRQKGIIIYTYEKKKAIKHTKCGACSRLPKQQMSVGLRNQYTGFLCPKEGGGAKWDCMDYWGASMYPCAKHVAN